MHAILTHHFAHGSQDACVTYANDTQLDPTDDELHQMSPFTRFHCVVVVEHVHVFVVDEVGVWSREHRKPNESVNVAQQNVDLKFIK
jgi:hypothetical protein